MGVGEWWALQMYLKRANRYEFLMKIVSPFAMYMSTNDIYKQFFFISLLLYSLFSDKKVSSSSSSLLLLLSTLIRDFVY